MLFSIEIGSNNAGVLTKNRTRSCDGLELHFATNHIGTVRPLFATFSDKSLHALDYDLYSMYLRAREDACMIIPENALAYA
jgi:hypothetical protein